MTLCKHTWTKVLVGAVTLAVLLMVSPQGTEAAFSSDSFSDAQNCRRGFGKRAERFALTLEKLILKCAKKRRSGAVAPGVDCTDMDQDGADVEVIDVKRAIEKGEAMMRGIPGRRCGGVQPYQVGFDTCPVTADQCPGLPAEYGSDLTPHTTDDLYKCLICMVLAKVPPMMQDSLGAPAVAVCKGGADDGLACNACVGGTAAGRPCDADSDCGGGSCTLCAGGSCETSLCAGGTAAGSPCASDADCSGGGSCSEPVFDVKTEGKCHQVLAKVQTKHVKTILSQRAKCRRKDEKLGGVDPVSVCTADHCVAVDAGGKQSMKCRRPKDCLAFGGSHENDWACIDKRCYAACFSDGDCTALAPGAQCVQGGCFIPCQSACSGGPYAGDTCYGDVDCGDGGTCGSTCAAAEQCVSNSDLRGKIPQSRRSARNKIDSRCADIFNLSKVDSCAADLAGLKDCVVGDAEAKADELFTAFYPSIDCGDGVLGLDEECDDGPYNLDEDDGCNQLCAVTRCGDGVAQGDPECAFCSKDHSQACITESGGRDDLRCGYCLDSSCTRQGKCEKASQEGGCGSKWVGYRGYNGAVSLCVLGGVAQLDQLSCTGGDTPGAACTVDGDCPGLGAKCDARCADDADCSGGATCMAKMCSTDNAACTSDLDCTGDDNACVAVARDQSRFCLWDMDETAVFQCSGGAYDGKYCEDAAGGPCYTAESCADESCPGGACVAATVELICEDCDTGDIYNSWHPNRCRPTCVLPVCGDGVWDTKIKFGEQCDDGNDDNEDGCDNNCQDTSCGNGVVDIPQGEECDDGNNSDLDGCSWNCKKEICEVIDGQVFYFQCPDNMTGVVDLAVTPPDVSCACAPGAGACLGGTNEGGECTVDDDCPAGYCDWAFEGVSGVACSSDVQCPGGACVNNRCLTSCGQDSDCSVCNGAVCGDATACNSDDDCVADGSSCGSGGAGACAFSGDACNGDLDCSGDGQCGAAGACEYCIDVDECDASRYGGTNFCQGQNTGECVNLSGAYSCAIDCTAVDFNAAVSDGNCGAPTGIITFASSCQDAVIDLESDMPSAPSATMKWGDDNERQTPCNEMTIDGTDRNITFRSVTPAAGGDQSCRAVAQNLNTNFGYCDGGKCAGTEVDCSTDEECHYWDAAGECTEYERGVGFLMFNGDYNTIKNVTIRDFFEGIHARGSFNTIDSVTFDSMCDDAYTNGKYYGAKDGESPPTGDGYGNYVRGTKFLNGCDKCAQNYGGDYNLFEPDLGCWTPGHYSATYEGNTFASCKQPIRAADGGGGRFLFTSNGVYKNLAGAGIWLNGGQGVCDGPRLTAGGAGEIGKAEQGGFVAELEANTVDGCAHGVRIGGKVQAVFKNNTIQNNENRGVLIKKQARAMMQGNTITDNGGSSDGADPAYGGVAFETASNKTPEGDLGGGAVEIDGKTLTSTGGNQICNNSHANGSPVDLHVVGPSTISAYSNNSSGVCAGQTMNVLTEDGGQVLQ